MSQLVWLRNDLRLSDNPALFHACQTIDSNFEHPVRVVYCATPKQWQAHHLSAAQLGLCEGLLNSLSVQLATRGIPLEVIQSTDYHGLADAILSYCLAHGIKGLWLNKQIGFNEQQRDLHVYNRLQEHGINVHCLDNDLLISSPITTQSLRPYRVFTPWYKQWLAALLAKELQLLPEISEQPITKTLTPVNKITLPGAGNYRDDLWPASEEFACQRLSDFIESQDKSPVFDYQKLREYPAINGTSLLSAYIAVGAISIRQCYNGVQQACIEKHQPIEENVWLKELGWRDFYRYLMLNDSAVSKGYPFNPQKETGWLSDNALLSAWQQGCTGFPIIDAAMLQLTRTG